MQLQQRIARLERSDTTRVAAHLNRSAKLKIAFCPFEKSRMAGLEFGRVFCRLCRLKRLIP
jgi:hypothetical protein